ncbi:Uncharacterised protein [Janthinobacterium lividum]|uniref:hypothetical protein n=1 Tax=Janthinobacterium lividum TaxID=29581 RepID=UPI000DFFF143|nr:hypothetical protein [Janthinobacterium lividum]STQ92723.1 Uncharacterised protein [Janthinobacterium lividum]
MHLSFLPVYVILALSHIAAHAGTQADAPADAPADTGQSIHINSIRNPELKSYRVMAAGLDAFDAYHALAPKAREVRFQLSAGSRAPADAMLDLSLHIAGNETSIALPWPPTAVLRCRAARRPTARTRTWSPTRKRATTAGSRPSTARACRPACAAWATCACNAR